MECTVGSRALSHIPVLCGYTVILNSVSLLYVAIARDRTWACSVVQLITRLLLKVKLLVISWVLTLQT
jgi:hypothetical protein